MTAENRLHQFGILIAILFGSINFADCLSSHLPNGLNECRQLNIAFVTGNAMKVCDDIDINGNIFA